ncbi:MAG TPA: hypothetical protein PK864_02420 [Syntrophorhabdaceae bacterium]|nr:hypothetical protein [Syntrophorhabdaceae bacterium]HOT41494.1 hypothetical protein [Syntrophorhabdaceae bacterium]HPC65951.1 hypothetical protein [Syntrophorhabdaceae bacterium]HQE79235.1 hypothetical protein [Syntrophorhabdaceae bacterium]HQH42424.1 hypothetical protein [Syntrophorhabdaceae bacterium]
MSGTIKFQVFESESRFLDPRKGFEETVEGFQVRIDPLTGRTGHFSHFGAIRSQRLPLEDYLKPEVKGFCPFCKENRDKRTPKFIGDVVPEGRITRGETVLIPNLFPYDIHSAVAIMTDEHLCPVEGFTEKRLYDSLYVGIDFLKRIRSINPELPYHLMSWNYMPPSGGGLVHPHQQYFATEFPGNQFTDEYRASEEFFEKNRISFWDELLKIEKNTGQRFIGETGKACWITPFVSLGILGEIMCVFPHVFSVDDFDEGDMDALVSGLLKIFRYYSESGIYSFNAAMFFGKKDQRFFPCHFRIIPRTFLNMRDYAPDLNFFQSLLVEPVSVVIPEELCKEVKAYF